LESLDLESLDLESLDLDSDLPDEESEAGFDSAAAAFL
jgi:hypothetical protein